MKGLSLYAIFYRFFCVLDLKKIIQKKEKHLEGIEADGKQAIEISVVLILVSFQYIQEGKREQGKESYHGLNTRHSARNVHMFRYIILALSCRGGNGWGANWKASIHPSQKSRSITTIFSVLRKKKLPFWGNTY